MATRNTSLYGFAIGALSAVALVSTTSFAQGKKAVAPTAPSASAPTAPAAGVKKGEDKVDISDLENKYWAPKDTDFSVVQNRTYSKDGRFFLTGHFGRPINDQWSVGNVAGLSVNYFWSERFGVQATHVMGSMANNEASDFIASNYGSGIYADHNRFVNYTGLAFNIVPFYAKMSFWGKKIIYFDMAISPTIGTTTYEQQIENGGSRKKSAFTYGLDVTQYFFFTNYFAIRADLKNQFLTEEIARYHTSGGIPTGGKVKDDSRIDTLFLLGLTFFY
ncbi:MAG: outer membrane beta-barrel domain-containing protein [Bdellovibrionales bacterium]|nr:outer membrane beta-barrel domain-containing protein [Bdellovibrionales bacterium]